MYAALPFSRGSKTFSETHAKLAAADAESLDGSDLQVPSVNPCLTDDGDGDGDGVWGLVMVLGDEARLGMLIVVKDEWLVVRVYETKLCERCVWWWISCEFGKRR